MANSPLGATLTNSHKIEVRPPYFQHVLTMDAELCDMLLSVPLFVGMDKTKLMEIDSHDRLRFLKCSKGREIVKCGDRCLDIFFVVSGRVKLLRQSNEGSYTVEEIIDAPCAIQPERLYGFQQSFTVTVVSDSPCVVLSIDKKTLIRLFDQSLAVKLNMLNMLSTSQQRSNDCVWMERNGDTANRLLKFFAERMSLNAVQATFHISVQKLAAEINAGKHHVSAVLKELRDANLLSMRRGNITVKGDAVRP